MEITLPTVTVVQSGPTAAMTTPQFVTVSSQTTVLAETVLLSIWQIRTINYPTVISQATLLPETVVQSIQPVKT